MRTDIIVVDDFYTDPDRVRQLALSCKFYEDKNYYQGQRTEPLLADDIKGIFERLMQRYITKWNYPVNGAFQYTTAEDKLVYHMDSQQWAAIIYLTPHAPVESGTSFYKSNVSQLRMDSRLEYPEHDEDWHHTAVDATFRGGFLDSTKFTEIDRIGNVYNRLVIWNAKMIHAATKYFGKSKEDGRLFQIFFFDAE